MREKKLSCVEKLKPTRRRKATFKLFYNGSISLHDGEKQLKSRNFLYGFDDFKRILIKEKIHTKI